MVTSTMVKVMVRACGRTQMGESTKARGKRMKGTAMAGLGTPMALFTLGTGRRMNAKVMEKKSSPMVIRLTEFGQKISTRLEHTAIVI